MNAPLKLVGFCCVLAAVFGVAFLTGTQSAALLAPPEVARALTSAALSASSTATR